MSQEEKDYKAGIEKFKESIREHEEKIRYLKDLKQQFILDHNPHVCDTVSVSIIKVGSTSMEAASIYAKKSEVNYEINERKNLKAAEAQDALEIEIVGIHSGRKHTRIYLRKEEALKLSNRILKTFTK